MADNVAITAGSGTPIATDDSIASGVAASANVQRVKAGWGAAGSYTDPAVASPFPAQTTLESSQMSNVGTIVTPKFGVINTSASGDTQLVATDSVHKIRVLTYSFVCDAAVAVKFIKGTGGTAMTGAMSYAANGGITTPFCPVGHFETDTTHDLTINLSGAVGVRGHFTYALI